MLARLETGAARDWNVNETRMDLSAYGGSWRVVRPIVDSEVVVPYQTKLPAYFMAAVQTYVYPAPGSQPHQSYLEIMVLSRQSTRQPWKVAIDTGVAGDPLRQSFVGDPTDDVYHPGYNEPAPRPHWIRPEQAHAALVPYYRSWFKKGRAPARTPFSPGRATTILGESIAATSHRRGIARRLRYFTNPKRDGTYQFAFGGGHWNFTCSAIRGRDSETAADRHTALYQAADRGWGPGIAPGVYRRITSTLVHQSCIAISATRADGLGVFGNEGQDISEHAIRSTSVPTPGLAPASSGILHATEPPDLIPAHAPQAA